MRSDGKECATGFGEGDKLVLTAAHPSKRGRHLGLDPRGLHLADIPQVKSPRVEREGDDLWVWVRSGAKAPPLKGEGSLPCGCDSIGSHPGRQFWLEALKGEGDDWEIGLPAILSHFPPSTPCQAGQ